MTHPLLSISKEVQAAFDNNQPVVALESTIISHGMPYPKNVEMAKTVEQIIRDNGAVPATIAIMDGKFKIGLEEEDLELLATAENVAKVSRRDLANVFATKQIGATTVATTMLSLFFTQNVCNDFSRHDTNTNNYQKNFPKSHAKSPFFSFCF